MRKIILTGADGFIGRNIIKELQRKFIVVPLTRKNFELESCSSWEGLEKAQIVINLAAFTSVEESWLNPEKYLNNNTSITLNALKYCRENNAKFIALSSYMYGNLRKVPALEERLTIANNPYALSKKIDEDLIQFYIKYYNLDAIILRLFNVYGAQQSKRFLIGQMVEQAVSEKKIIVNDLRPKRDFIHIKDVQSAFLKILLPNEPFRGSVFNICSGKSYSVQEIALKIAKELPFDVEIVNKNVHRKNEIMDSLGSFKKIKDKYGWFPTISIEDGIRSMLADKKVS